MSARMGLWLIAGLLAWTPSAPGQEARSSVEAPASVVEPDGFLLRSLIRVALLDLRAAEPPRPRDYAVAAALLDRARDMAPNDADLTRRYIEACWGAGDTQGVLSASRRLAALDPQDTVNQLRLITSAISREQTAEGRIALYERFLAVPEQDLDASVRSRLALDLALLQRERGDEAAFVGALKRAVVLDSTNKDAAMLALNLYRDRVNDPSGRLELTSNLLMADPMDPNVLRALRDEMALGGAYKASRRFHDAAWVVLDAARVKQSAEDSALGLVLQWINDGAEGVVTKITDDIRGERERIRRMQAVTSAGNPTLLGEAAGRPEDRRLLPAIEQVRCLAAFSVGAMEKVTTSIADYGATVQALLKTLEDPATRPPNLDEATMNDQVALMRADLCLYRLLTNIDTGLIDEDVAALGALPESDARRIAVEAWRLYRSGDAGAAFFRAGDDPESLWCALLVGQAAEDAGQMQAALTAYRHAMQAAPLTAPGAYAATRVRRLVGEGMPLTDRTRALEAYAQGVPAWIDQMASRPRSFMVLEAVPAKSNGGALDYIPVRLSVRNISPIPLGLGTDRSICSRFLFGPNLETVPGGANAGVEPEVSELTRRLRLMPGEEIAIDVWPDAGLTGWIGEVSAAAVVRTRWRIIQGFQPAANSGQEIGPGCLELNLPAISRNPLEEARMGGKALLDKLPSTKHSQVPAVVSGFRSAIITMQAATPAEVSANRTMMVDAMLPLYPTWPARERAIAAAVIPNAVMAPELEPLDALIRADEDPLVRAIAIVTRVSKADDPALAAAEGSGDARLAALARLQRERIADNSRCYATVGVRIREVVQPSRRGN
ncbi:MAG: hypothetical protein HUU18_12615 [Phycisphaerales bacterium]|nr:hypothetical protein [Phycisphaerales bacterium]